MDELILTKGVPAEVTPSKMSATIQNSMKTSDDMLFISTHGDVNKAWISVAPGESVKFSEPLFFMQNSWTKWVFPVIEHD